MLRYDPYEVLMLTIVQGKGNGGVIGTIGVALSIGIYPKIVKDIATHKKAKNIQRWGGDVDKVKVVEELLEVLGWRGSTPSHW